MDVTILNGRQVSSARSTRHRLGLPVSYESELGGVTEYFGANERAADDVAEHDETHRPESLLRQQPPRVRAVDLILLVGHIAEDCREEQIDREHRADPSVGQEYVVVDDAAVLLVQDNRDVPQRDEHKSDLQRHKESSGYEHPAM